VLNLRKITDDISIAGQPTADELQNARRDGIRTIINLRMPDEKGGPADEERLVESSGAGYVPIPVSPATLDDAAVERFSQALSSENALPAIVHCQGGGRAGVMTLLHLAIQHGWSLQETFDAGRRLGIGPAEDSPYRAFFVSFIKRHSPAERPTSP
jgi:uncharacterized protein (TIGR01244 family)